MGIKEFFAEQFFKYEFGVRFFNNLRMVLMIVTMVNTFMLLLNIPVKYYIVIYGGSVLFGTVGIWLIGHVLDKFGMWFSIDKAYFKRGKNTKELDDVVEKLMKRLDRIEEELKS